MQSDKTKCRSKLSQLYLSQHPKHPLASSQITLHPSVAKNPNPWKHGSSRCNSFVPWPLSPMLTESPLQLHFSRTKLPSGGDLTTRPLTGRLQPLPGMDFSLPSDNSSPQLTPRSVLMTDFSGYHRRHLSMPTTTNSEPSCLNSLTWTRPPA
jgi:hypothetical protein